VAKHHIINMLHDFEIKAIAVDGTSGTVLLTDEFGIPLSPALMYDDQGCTEENITISTIAPDNYTSRSNSSSLAKALYLLKQYPDAKYLCHQADWISSNLSGRFGLSDENNCLKTGYDIEQRCWPDYIKQLGIGHDLLPTVLVPGTRIGNIDEDNASILGVSNQCQIISGTTDSIAAFIATGAKQIGTGVTSLGSTLSIKMITSNPVFSAKDGIYSHRLGDLWLVGGASNTGGRVLQQLFDQQQIDELSRALDVAHFTGLNYYPLPVKGERFPINDPELEPTMEPRPESDRLFFQALLEGITQIEKMAYEKLTMLSQIKLHKIISAGGGSKNTRWTKIREKTIGVDITTARQTEASFGSALLARQGVTFNA